MVAVSLAKKPAVYKPRSVKPYGGPAPQNDYGQNALYPQGYNLPKNPVDMSTFFTGGGGKQYMDLGGQAMQNPYRNMIGGDWDVQGTESAMNAAMGRARGDFQSQIRQALINLGVTDKQKLGDFGQYIDADTISKAAENKYSQVAQSQQMENRARAQSEADLAARGMLTSGQLSTDQENILAQGEQSRYNALRDFLGAGQSGLTQLADMQDQWSQQLMGARFAAAQRAADLYNQAEYWDWENQQGRYGPPAGAPPVAAAAAAPKQPLYQAMGPYGPYGPAVYTQQQLNQQAKRGYPWQ